MQTLSTEYSGTRLTGNTVAIKTTDQQIIDFLQENARIAYVIYESTPVDALMRYVELLEAERDNLLKKMVELQMGQ